MFSGLMFCKDCGSKMYFYTAKEFEHNQNWFTCALARKNKDACSGHFIREVQVEAAFQKHVENKQKNKQKRHNRKGYTVI